LAGCHFDYITRKLCNRYYFQIDSYIISRSRTQIGFAFVGFENKEIVATVTKDRYHQINGKTVEVKGCDEQEAYQKKKQQENRGYNNRNQDQQQIQTVVPAVQTIQTVPAQAQPQIQYQLPNGQIQQFAQQPQQIGAGYTVIPAGYSYDPATGIIYQAALPQQAAIPGAAGLAAAGQLSQIQTIGGLPQQYIQAGQIQGQLQAGQLQAGQLQAGQLQAGQLQAGQLQAAGQQAVVSAAPASAYQPIALGQQYSQDPSTFGAQRAVTVQSTIPVQQGQLTTQDQTGQLQQIPNQQDGQQQDMQRNTQRSFHPYGR
jgi:hypothetical protein